MFQRLYDILYEFREYAILAGLIVISSVLMAMNDNAQVKQVRAISTVIFGGVQEQMSFIPTYFRLKSENELLRHINIELADEAQRLREAKLENLRLRQLLEIKGRQAYKLIAAHIVNKNLTLLRNTITINVGSKDKVDRIASLYGPSENGGCKVILKPDTSWMSRPATFLGGGGKLFSTATDYMIFAQMLLNMGEYNGVRLLSTKTVELMTKNHVPEDLLPAAENNYKGLGFGLGFAVFMNQTEIYGTEGTFIWSGAFSTRFFIDKKEDLIWILMTQFSPNRYYPIHREFPVLVYQSIID